MARKRIDPIIEPGPDPVTRTKPSQVDNAAVADPPPPTTAEAAAAAALTASAARPADPAPVKADKPVMPPAVYPLRPSCVRCASADLTRGAMVNEIAHHSAHEGKGTTRRRWQRAQCNKCGQWQTIIEDFNP